MNERAKRILTYTGYFYLIGFAFTVTNIGPCNGPISEQFHIPKNVMGILISTHFAGFIISVMYSGYLVDRIGLKPVMVGATALLGVTMATLGASWNVASLFVMMFLAGMGGGGVEAAVNALFGAIYEDTRVHALNKLHMFFGVGAFIWPTIAGMYLGDGGSWRVLYYVIGAFSSLMAVIMALQKFPVSVRMDQVKPSDILDMLKNPTVLILGLLIAFYVGGEMGINAWIVRYFDEVLHADEVLKNTGAATLAGIHINAGGLNSSFFLTMYWFSITLGRLIATALGRYIPDIAFLRVMTGVSCVCSLATFSLGNMFLAAAFLFLTGLFFSGIFATAIAIGGNMFPERSGIVGGIIIGFSGIGNIVFSAGVGWISQAAGLRAGMLFASAMLVFMTICSFMLKKSNTQTTRSVG